MIRSEEKYGKIIVLEDLIKRIIKDSKCDSFSYLRINRKEIMDIIELLTISGYIYHPRKGFLQRL